jgi:hypothetical protein
MPLVRPLDEDVKLIDDWMIIIDNPYYRRKAKYDYEKEDFNMTTTAVGAVFNVIFFPTQRPFDTS